MIYHIEIDGLLSHSYSLQFIILMQLESAGGGPDNEAREALTRLQTSLQTLEAAKAGAFDHIDTSQGDISAPSVAINEDSLPQQMETLQGRVGNLERRLEELPPGTKEILGSAAGEWIGVQLHSSDGVQEEKTVSQSALPLPPPS